MSSKKLASLLIKIGVNGVAVEKAFRDITKKAEEAGKTLKKVGDKMSLYLTAPILAAGAASVKAADTQLRAEAKLLNALKGRADIQKRLMAQASEIQSRSLYGDEAIIEQQSFLAALGLTEEQISATMEAAVQLSAALGIDLGSAVKNLAKTYGGLTGELGESIPALRDLTAEELKAGGAIAYVNENYKGFAETAARTGTGPMQQLKNSLGDLAEQLGVILMPVIQKITEWLSHLVAWLQQLSPGVQKLIVGIAALAAAAGPLFSVGGKILTLIPKISVALKSMAGPIGIVISLVARLAWELSNALTLRDRLEAEQGAAYRGESESQWQRHYQNTVNTVAGMSDEHLSEYLAETRREWDEFQRSVNNDLSNLSDAQKRRQGIIFNQEKAIVEEINRRKAKPKTTEIVLPDLNSFNAGVVQATGLIGKLEARLSELEKAKVWAKTSDEIRQINQDIQGVNDELERLRSLTYGVDVGSAEGVTIRSSVPGFGVSSAIASPLASILPDSQISEWREKMLQKAEAMKSVITEINDIIRSAVAGLATSIGEMLGDLWTGDTFDPVQMLLELLGNAMKQIGAALVKYATMIIALKAALKNIMLNPWLALGLGIVTIAAGTALINYANRREYVPKLAKGGLAYGPTLAVVGDNPNAASDPEVIAPLSKLRSMGAANRLELVGEVEWKISGSSLRAVLGKENFRLSRLG